MSSRQNLNVRIAAVAFGVLALLNACASASPRGALSADRPGFVDLTPTVAPGVVQTEGGYTRSNASTDTYHSIGEGLLRIGYAPRAEFRLHANSFARLSSAQNTSSGWEDVRVGTKIRLFDAPAAVSPMPAVSLLLSSTMPTGGAGFGSDRWQPEAKVAIAWGLPARLSLATNLVMGRVNTGGAWHTRDAGGAALGFAATPRVAPYVGYYLWKVRDGASSASRYVDGGFGILLTDDIQVDVRAGFGRNHIDNDHFFGLGIAKRW
jgi:hypothetical protein